MGALSEISSYLVQTFLSLYLLAMLLRFLLQVVKADFYNPICQFLVKATNPLVLPVRRVIPGFGGLDISTLLLCIVIQIVSITAILLLNGYSLPNPLLLLAWSGLGVASLLVNIYFFALLGMIILSWVAPGSNNPAVYLLYQITEPVMAPVRKRLPAMGGLDFSPILIFVAINVIQMLMARMAASIGLPASLVIGL